MMDAESMPFASYSRGRGLHVLHERAKDLLIPIPNLLFLPRLKRILRHFPEFFVRVQLFLDLVKGAEVRKETLIEFQLNRIAADAQVFEFGSHKTVVGLVFLEKMIGRDSSNKAVGGHHIKKV